MVVYSIGLIKPAEFLAILGIRRTEFVWALAAFAGVMLFGTLKGILVAIILSLAALAYQVADPPVRVLGRKPGTQVFRPRTTEHPEDETLPGSADSATGGPGVLRQRRADRSEDAGVHRRGQTRVVAIDLSAVFDLEYTALKMLTEAEKRSREQGVELWLVDLNPAVLTMVQRSPLGRTLGRERMFFNLEMAAERYRTIGSGLPDARLRRTLGEALRPSWGQGAARPGLRGAVRPGGSRSCIGPRTAAGSRPR